jgi:hypothetical protein
MISKKELNKMDREGGAHTDGITTIYWLIQPSASFLRLACGDWKN